MAKAVRVYQLLLCPSGEPGETRVIALVNLFLLTPQEKSVWRAEIQMVKG
jgi:hypothetical protein